MITAKIAVATSPKNNFLVNLQLNKNVTQTERQKLAQKKLTKNAELNKPVTDQRRFESRARLEQDSKHSAPFETEDEAKFQTNYYTSIIYVNEYTLKNYKHDNKYNQLNTMIII